MHKIYYKGLQGCYWMLYSASFGYLTYYLGELGFSDSLIGVITAGFGILGIILQPIVGGLADNPKHGWKKFLFPLVASIAVAAVIQFFCPIGFITGMIAGYVTLIEGMTISLVNQACFACSAEDDVPDYGSARGVGSFTYAIVSVGLGQLTSHLGPKIIPVVQLVICLLMLFVIFKLPCVMRVDSAIKESKKKEAFFKKYPHILIVFVGLIFLMLFHCGTTTYMIKITDNVGGDSGAMGIALAISAIAEIPIMFTFGRIAKKFSTNFLLAFSGIFFIVKGLFYLLSTNVMGIYISQAFQILSFAIYANAYVYYAKENVRHEDATTGQAYLAITTGIGTVLGSLFGGFLIGNGSVKLMVSVSLVFAVLGTIILYAYAFAYRKKTVTL